MSIPKPEKALEGHCSAINDDTLYVFSPDSFQSLHLKENATWSEEKMGTPVTGAVCVKAGNALYVVGGTTDDDGYNGVQRYHFDQKAWETLSLPTDNIKGRTNHSAAYLQDANAILVYAGSQSDAPSLLSSQTFAIELTDPYNIESFVSSAPPSNQPILLPWNSSHAVLAGGSPFSSEVFTFDHAGGWQPLGTNLSEPLQPGVRATLVNGNDGSKVLETYDMTSLPNMASQIVLLDAHGQTAPNGQTIGSSSSRKRKRDLTLDNWPQYNSTDAPSTSRTDFAVAQDSKGLAVMSGGNDDAPVSLFSQTDNSWVDAGKFFNGDDQQPLQPKPSVPTSSSTPTSTSEPSATSSEAAGAGGLSSHDKMLRTLGITLGVLCGIAAIFIAALLYVRWRKMKKRKQEGYVDEKTGNRLSFADRGASFMKEAEGSIDHLAPPPKNPYAPGAGSHSSLAIIAGRYNGNKRNTAGGQRGSFESTAPLRDKEFGEPVEMMDIGEKSPAIDRRPFPPPQNLQVPVQGPPTLAVFGASPEEHDSQLRNRSSGWSRYFATSQPNGNNEHLPTAYTKDRESIASQWPSNSTVSRIPSSAFVPPLDIDFSKTVGGQRLSSVVTGSPSFSDSREDLARGGSVAEGQRGLIEGHDRPVSTNTDVSSAYDRSTMSSDFYSGLAADRGSTPWTPVSNSFKDHLNNRPITATSSNYTSSIYDQRLPSRAARSQNSGFFPGSGTMNMKPAKLKLGHNASASHDWAASGGAGKDSPLLKSPPAIMAPAPVHDRDSSATVFPHQNGNRWTANAPKDAGAGAMQPPHPTNAFEQQQGLDRASTATVFPHDNGNRWTANMAKDTMGGALQPPRAPALTGGAAAMPSNDRDSTVTVFPHEDGNDVWTAGALKAPNAPGLANDGAHPSNDRDSTVTVFPRGVPSAYYANRPKEIDEHEAGKKPMNSDMSWLDLGASGNRI